MRRMQTVITALMILFLVTACAGEAENQSSTGPAIIDPATAEPALVQENQVNTDQDDRFSATPGPDGGVELDWEEFDDAENYLLELQVGGSEFIPLTVLAGDTFTYEDVDVPADTEFVYRLTAISRGVTAESLTATITTTPQVPDPLKLTL